MGFFSNLRSKAVPKVVSQVANISAPDLSNIPQLNFPNLDFSKIPQGIKIPGVPNIPQPTPILSEPKKPRGLSGILKKAIGDKPKPRGGIAGLFQKPVQKVQPKPIQPRPMPIQGTPSNRGIPMSMQTYAGLSEAENARYNELLRTSKTARMTPEAMAELKALESKVTGKPTLGGLSPLVSQPPRTDVGAILDSERRLNENFGSNFKIMPPLPQPTVQSTVEPEVIAQAPTINPIDNISVTPPADAVSSVPTAETPAAPTEQPFDRSGILSLLQNLFGGGMRQSFMPRFGGMPFMGGGMPFYQMPQPQFGFGGGGFMPTSYGMGMPFMGGGMPFMQRPMFMPQPRPFFNPFQEMRDRRMSPFSSGIFNLRPSSQSIRAFEEGGPVDRSPEQMIFALDQEANILLGEAEAQARGGNLDKANEMYRQVEAINDQIAKMKGEIGDEAYLKDMALSGITNLMRTKTIPREQLSAARELGYMQANKTPPNTRIKIPGFAAGGNADMDETTVTAPRIKVSKPTGFKQSTFEFLSSDPLADEEQSQLLSALSEEGSIQEMIEALLADRGRTLSDMDIMMLSQIFAPNKSASMV